MSVTLSDPLYTTPGTPAADPSLETPRPAPAEGGGMRLLKNS